MDRHLRGILSISRNETALQTCFHIANGFLTFNMKNISTRAQKGQLCTIFRGCANRHLRGILTLSRDDTALQVYFYIAMMCT